MADGPPTDRSALEPSWADEVPRRASNAPPRAPGAEVERFVLARVNGALTNGDLGLLTGLGEQVRDVLASLERGGWLASTPATAGPSERASGRPTRAPGAPSAPATYGERATSDSPASARSGPASEDPDALEPETRARVDAIFARLATATHYEILGVDANADRKRIKAAYYGVATTFHPDRYFRKNLGRYRERLEAVFDGLTRAHDVLTSAEGRQRYDDYLRERRDAERIQSALGVLAEYVADGDVAVTTPVTGPTVSGSTPAPGRPISPAPKARSSIRAPSEVAISVVPPPASSKRRPSSKPPASSPLSSRGRALPSGPPSSARGPASGVPILPPTVPPSVHVPPAPRLPSAEVERARRQALAAKLRGGRATTSGMAAVPVSPTPVSARPTPRSANEMRASAIHTRVQQYVTLGHAAASRGEVIEAANAFRLAATLDPHDSVIRDLHKTWSDKAHERLGASYLRQAVYEAQNERWSDASASFVRAAGSLPDDAGVLRMAATALLRGNGPPPKAVEYARRAVLLEPGSAAGRAALGEAYIVAGQPALARRELEEAVRIDGRDEKFRALLRRVT